LNLDALLQENPDIPDSTDTNAGTGLNAFINNLPGGRKLRIRTRKAMQEASTKVKSEINQTKTEGRQALSAPNVASTVGRETGNQNNNTPQTNNPGGTRLN
jgi:hypothetical protein